METAFPEEFMPSTLEHRPLKNVEKAMLKRYFETTGEEHLGELANWEWANTEALKTLEAWAWGIRFWGRETLFHVSMQGFLLCRSCWSKLEQAEQGAEVQAILSRGLDLPVVLQNCRKWAKLPGEEIAKAVWESRGDDPMKWIESDLAPHERQHTLALTMIAAHRMASTVLLPRDEAARMAGQTLICSTLALQHTSLAESEAVSRTRAFVSTEMRKWFGRKW
jgi:hypothetical protein